MISSPPRPDGGERLAVRFRPFDPGFLRQPQPKYAERGPRALPLRF